jgi:hypothetical protein
MTTDIQGEKRFISTISRRLDSLGALTKGDRKTAGAGLFSAADNLESAWAQQALGIFYSNLVWGSADCMGAEEFQRKTGISLFDADGEAKSADDLPPINTWLNRVLALRIADQNAIFADFQAILDALLERAADSGALDRGIEDIAAEDVTQRSEEVIRRDTATGAETTLLTFDIRIRREILTADAALDWAPMSSSGIYRNSQTGHAAIVQKGLTLTDSDGRLTKGVRFFRPLRRETMTSTQFKESAWVKAEEPDWRAAWDAEVAATDPWVVRPIAMVTGLLLPIWTKLPGHQAQVRRLKAPDGRRWLGRVLELSQVPQLRLQLGLSDVAQIAEDANALLALVLEQGADVQLAENLWLRRVVFMGRPRLEIVNGAAHRIALKALGAWVEIVNFTPRVFLPTDRADILATVVKRWPATQILARGRAA